MSFEDPFASDLANFGATTNAIRRDVSRDGAAALGLGGATTLAAGTPATPRGIVEFDIGGPGGGRRRRAGETPAPLGGGAGMGTQGAAPLQTVNQPLLQGQGGLPPTGRRPPPAQPLQQPPLSSASGAPWLAADAPLSFPQSQSQRETAQRNTLLIDDDDPLGFLEGNARKGGSDAAASLGPSASRADAGGRAGVSAEEAAAAAARAKQGEEMRELYAQLYALDEENAKAEEKLHLQEAKEEAELLTLATTVIEKQMELDRQEGQLQDQCNGVRRSTEERLASVRKRYDEELAEQEAEVRRLESDRYGRLVRQVKAGLTEADEALQKLHAQKRLILDEDPFSAQSLLITLSADKEGGKEEGVRRSPRGRHKQSSPTSASSASAAGMEGAREGSEDGAGYAASAFHTSASATESSSRSRDEDGESSESSSESSDEVNSASSSPDHFEHTLRRGVALLKRYCDRHLSVIKDRVVDYIHGETLSVAHDTRTQSLLAWATEAADRKEELGEHLQAMVQRYMDLSQTRAAQKQASLQVIHAELAATTNQLRQDATSRLHRLTTEVSARLRATTESFEKIAKEHSAHLQQKISQTIAGDVAMAQAQQDETARRFETEDRVRRQLRAAAHESLSDELRRLRAKSDANAGAAFASLRERALAATSGACDPLQTQVADLRQLVDTLTADERRAQQQRCRQGWSSATDTAEDVALVMSHQEREGSVCALQSVVKRTQDELLGARARLREVYAHLCAGLEDHVHALREKRLAQQSHQSAIDFTRTAWERDHQRNLKMGLHVEVPAVMTGGAPTGGCIDGKTPCPTAVTTTTMTTETHAAPGDVFLVALLDLARGTLSERGARLRDMRAHEKGLALTYRNDFAALSRQLGTLRKRWTTVMDAVESLEQERGSLATQELGVYKEMVENRVQRDAAARQRAELEQRRVLLEQRSDQYQAESETVMAAYDAEQEKLKALSDDQLGLAMDVQMQQVRQLRQSPYIPSQFLRDCTNDGDPKQKQRLKAAKPSRRDDSNDSIDNDAEERSDRTPPRQMTPNVKELRRPPRSPSSTPPSAAANSSHSKRRITPTTKVEGHHGRKRDSPSSRSPYSSTSTSAPGRQTATGSGPSYYDASQDSSSSRLSTAPAGAPTRSHRHRHYQGDVRTQAGGGDGSASPLLNTSAVSASSPYRSGTFTDLVTLLDSTLASAVETP